MVRTLRFVAVAFVSLSFSCGLNAQQIYTEEIPDTTEIFQICSEVEDISRAYQRVVSDWETAQKNLTECTVANCDANVVGAYTAEADRLDRHRLLLEQRLALEDGSFVGTVSDEIVTDSDEPVFVLGERLDFNKIDLSYVQSAFPVHVVDDELRHVGEVRGRKYSGGNDLRLMVRPRYGYEFVYSLAGQVSEICSTLAENDYLILSFGIEYPVETQTPLGLNLNFRIVGSPDRSAKVSSLNHYSIIQPVFEAFFSLLPHRKEKAEEFRGYCPGMRSRTEGDLFTAIGAIRGALAVAVGGGDWPTERQLFANSKVIFGSSSVNEVTIELNWNETKVGTIVVRNEYDTSDWPHKFDLRVQSVHQGEELVFGCVRSRF